MGCSTSSGGWRAMPDRGSTTARRASLAVAVLLAAGAVAAVWAPVALAVPGPGSECDAEAAPSGQSESCQEGGLGGFDLGLVAVVGGAAVVGGVLALGIAFLVLRRRAAPPLIPEPIDAQEWWACPSCGRNNVVGSARCYNCGTLKR